MKILGMGWYSTQIVKLRILTTDSDNHITLTVTEILASVTAGHDSIQNLMMMMTLDVILKK